MQINSQKDMSTKLVKSVLIKDEEYSELEK